MVSYLVFLVLVVSRRSASRAGLLVTLCIVSYMYGMTSAGGELTMARDQPDVVLSACEDYEGGKASRRGQTGAASDGGGAAVVVFVVLLSRWPR